MKKEYSLKNLKRRPGKVKVDPSATKVPVSLRIDGADLADLKEEAERQGTPYQTLIGSILHRYIHGELVDRKSIESLKNLLVS